jgi:nicotinamide riboside kinase
VLKKVVILGPESTGKSFLSEQLANQYDTLWCPEYAREYLLKNGVEYSFNDLLEIAKGHLQLEDEFAERVRKSGRPKVREVNSDKVNEASSEGKSTAPKESGVLRTGLPDFRTSGLLFIDTDMYVMKIWCEFAYDKCHKFILDQIVKRKYDLYLLCKPDLPWIADELREYPDLEIRERLYRMYQDLMINQSTPWVEISGDYDSRLKKAIEAVDQLLLK